MRKLKLTKIILVFILIYIGSNIISIAIKKNMDTLTLKNETIQESFKKRGLIIRDEYLLNSSMSGNIKYCIKEGERVKQNDNIAYIYNENVNKEVLNKLSELQKDISNIKKGNTNIVKSDVKNLNNHINKACNSIQKKLLNGNIDVRKDIENLSKLIEDKNYIIGSDLNSKSLENKKLEEKEVNSIISKNSELFKAKNSGIVSYKFDGNEDKFTIDKISEIKKEDIENTQSKYENIQQKNKVKKDETLARVIKNLKQYVAISCSEEEVKKLDVGQKIILSSEIEKINSNVYDIYKDGKDYIAIFEISEQNVEIYDTRVKEFDIIYKSMEGLKVPKKSIISVDGKKGVYAISETGDAKFVEIKGNLYDSEEYIIIDHYKNDINGINTISIYDEIILNPKLKKFFGIK
ncbi:HlyD family efflux transporter periplasmic adaptor subunit [Paraclostridium tenue]|uniref:HlyD family secretion protein n=1 Tax=Paraclostridium tenue TaxID=1737 RepID=A0ABP3X5J4_9FIRM